MNSPLPYDVMSIIYKQLSIDDKRNLITSMQIFKIWFSADLINELFCKSGCVRCVPDGHTELRLLSPEVRLGMDNDKYTDQSTIYMCTICNIYYDIDVGPKRGVVPFLVHGIIRWCDMCRFPNLHCKSCANANDDFKMCEGCQNVILYNKKCANHYDPLRTRCNMCQ
jgi:hypothetical protein